MQSSLQDNIHNCGSDPNTENKKKENDIVNENEEDENENEKDENENEKDENENEKDENENEKDENENEKDENENEEDENDNEEDENEEDENDNEEDENDNEEDENEEDENDNEEDENDNEEDENEEDEDLLLSDMELSLNKIYVVKVNNENVTFCDSESEIDSVIDYLFCEIYSKYGDEFNVIIDKNEWKVGERNTITLNVVGQRRNNILQVSEILATIQIQLLFQFDENYHYLFKI